MENLEWGANWVKGDKPIETETSVSHDQKRCKEIQGVPSGPVRLGWIQRECDECHVITRYNKKR